MMLFLLLLLNSYQMEWLCDMENLLNKFGKRLVNEMAVYLHDMHSIDSRNDSIYSSVCNSAGLESLVTLD